MKWILIAWVVSYGDGGGMITQEFNDKAHCDFALNELFKLSKAKTSFVMCVPKGLEPVAEHVVPNGAAH